ncbi:MAG: hypothetical protein Q8Q85_09770 [Gemmatimonadales bacterium]|nr:hypothetical protein [Gemmatimonadales bacterium]
MPRANWKEIAVVVVVGLGVAAVVTKVPLVKKFPLLTGAALYGMGYVVATQRPAGGWKLLTAKA